MFCGCHKIVCVGVSVLGSDCNSIAVAVWQMLFSSHGVHGSMLNWRSCACGNMLTKKIVTQENNFCICVMRGFYVLIKSHLFLQ
jgi:hypothetical protein